MNPIFLQMEREQISKYRDLGKRHLQIINTIVCVAEFGVNDSNGKKLYSVLLKSPDGNEWYNDSKGKQENILAWEKQEDAEVYLNEYILPNIGLSCMLDEHRASVRHFQSLIKNHETT